MEKDQTCFRSKPRKSIFVSSNCDDKFDNDSKIYEFWLIDWLIQCYKFCQIGYSSSFLNLFFRASIRPLYFSLYDVLQLKQQKNLSISGKTHVLKFADIERFFCCFNCRTSYKEKYSGRIEAIKKRFKKDDE